MLIRYKSSSVSTLYGIVIAFSVEVSVLLTEDLKRYLWA